MTLDDLIGIAQNRLTYLSKQRDTAVLLGDMDQISKIDEEVSLTTSTLNKLLSVA